MRPEDFSPGNDDSKWDMVAAATYASMRPEDFSPGNASRRWSRRGRSSRFNEAGGFLPRKHDPRRQRV